MSDKRTGDVSIDVDGTTYTLALTLDAMVALEKLFSTSEKHATFGEIADAADAGSAEHLRAFIWALLRRHHPEVTIEDVSALVERGGGLVVFTDRLKTLSARMATPVKPAPKAARTRK